MWLQQANKIFGLILILQTCYSITVIDKPKRDEGEYQRYTSEKSNGSTTSTTNYRVSVPKIKQPSNRVPLHLQGVTHTGYIVDDADDVIHIIEPPKHFQQLKRLINNRKGETAAAEVWQQQSKVHIKRPPQQIVATAMKVKEQQRQQHQQQQKGAKVEMPQRYNVKPAVATTANTGSDVVGSDLLTEETKVQSSTGDNYMQQQQQQQQQLQQHHLNYLAKFPLEILASVRKTERLRQKLKPLMPLAKQRVKTKKIQTVIMEKHYEHGKYERGNEYRVGGDKKIVQHNQHNLKKTRRQKRDLTELELIKPGRIGEVHEAGESKFNKKEEPSTAKNDKQKGGKILMHISELLKNASVYLSDDLEENLTPKSEENSNTKSKEKFDAKLNTSSLQKSHITLRNESKLKKLLGEMDVTKRSIINNKIVKEKELQRILENSLNATNAIIKAIMSKGNVRNFVQPKCANNLSNTLENIQNKLKCMEEFLLKSTQDSQKINFNLVKKRCCERQYGSVAASTFLTNENQRTFTMEKSNGNIVRNARHSRNSNISSSPPSPRENTGSSLSGSLLYDDIMTNIRSMLQANNFNTATDNENDSIQNVAAGQIAPHFIDDKTRRFIDLPTELERRIELESLEQYLSDLHEIVADMPTVTAMAAAAVEENNNPQVAATTELTLNSHEFIASETTPTTTNWYLINGQGNIYETSINEDIQPTSTLFHRFPDIPNAELLLNNRTLATDTYDVLYE